MPHFRPFRSGVVTGEASGSFDRIGAGLYQHSLERSLPSSPSDARVRVCTMTRRSGQQFM